MTAIKEISSPPFNKPDRSLKQWKSLNGIFAEEIWWKKIKFPSQEFSSTCKERNQKGKIFKKGFLKFCGIS